MGPQAKLISTYQIRATKLHFMLANRAPKVESKECMFTAKCCVSWTLECSPRYRGGSCAICTGLASKYNIVVSGGSRQSPMQFRETFARACFEALLQFSFIHSKDPSMGKSVCRLGYARVPLFIKTTRIHFMYTCVYYELIAKT